MNQVNLYINTKETRSNFTVTSIKIILYIQKFNLQKKFLLTNTTTLITKTVLLLTIY